MTDELKPCPFCGGGGAGYMDDVQYPDTPNERVWYAVTCGKCDANGAWDLGKSGAVEKWNTRRLEDALRARIAELEAARDEARTIAKTALHELGRVSVLSGSTFDPVKPQNIAGDLEAYIDSFH